MTVYEPNPEWDYPPPSPFADLEGYEPWEPDEEPDREPIGCHYCDNTDTRIDPFGGKPCCDECFNILIGGEPDDPPFRCGTCEP